MTLKVDVIMPTWNSARTLNQALVSIEKGIQPSRIIVVDRDSEDGTQDIARSHGCVLIRDTKSLGSARMKGIQESNTEWIAFVDDDVVLPPDYLDRMERFIDEKTGALWSPCVSIVEPFRSNFIAYIEKKFDRSNWFALKPGDRGCTNSTLIRRKLVHDLDISDMDAWEDWVITQKVLQSNMEWRIVEVYSDHIHQKKDFFYKGSWNFAGMLNLGRTGRISKRQAIGDYLYQVRHYARAAFERTVVERDVSQFTNNMRTLFAVLYALRHFVGTKKRMG
jgi:glycosyltransferase involved in cell wall biosynthesis